MKYCIEFAHSSNNRSESGPVEHIKFDEMKSRPSLEMRDVAASAKPQIVHAPNFIAALEQSVTKMASDKACAASH